MKSVEQQMQEWLEARDERLRDGVERGDGESMLEAVDLVIQSHAPEWLKTAWNKGYHTRWMYGQATTLNDAFNVPALSKPGREKRQRAAIRYLVRIVANDLISTDGHKTTDQDTWKQVARQAKEKGFDITPRQAKELYFEVGKEIKAAAQNADSRK